MICTIFDICFHNNHQFEILNNLHIDLNILASFLYIISFVGLINNIDGKKDKIKLLIFSIVSLLLLYKAKRITVFFITFGVYVILAIFKFYNEYKKSQDKKNIIVTCILVAMFLLGLFLNQQQATDFRQWKENPNKILQERMDESKTFGKSKLEKDDYIQYVYSNFSYYSFTYLIENYGKIFGLLVISSFILLTIRFIKNYSKIKDSYGKLLSLGIWSFLILQFIISIFIRIGIINLQNVNIPFIVHDDLSIIIYMISISLIISINSRKNIYDNNNFADTKIIQ